MGLGVNKQGLLLMGSILHLSNILGNTDFLLHLEPNHPQQSKGDNCMPSSIGMHPVIGPIGGSSMSERFVKRSLCLYQGRVVLRRKLLYHFAV